MAGAAGSSPGGGRKPLVCPACGTRIGDRDVRCIGCGADVRLWVRRGGQVWGPYDLATVRRGMEEGRVVGDDEVAVGDGPWRRVREVSVEPAAGPPRREGVPSSRTLGVSGKIVAAGMAITLAVGAWGWWQMTSTRAAARCRQNLRCMWLAWRAYRVDFGEGPAAGADWPARLSAYLPPTAEWWTCPSTGLAYVVGVGEGNGALAWEQCRGGRGPHGRRCHVVKLDGTVQAVSAAQVPSGGVVVRGYAPGEPEAPGKEEAPK